MGSKSNIVESIKEAVSSASRAISENPEIELNFGGMGSSLPSPPSSYGELASFRGKADALACVDKFRDKTIHVDAGSQRLNSLMQDMENVRVEALGSKTYPGIASNISAKFEEKCSLYELFEEKDDVLNIALEGWLRKLFLPDISNQKSSELFKDWEKEFEEKGSLFKKELIDSLEDQIKFAEISRTLLKALAIEEIEPLSEEDQQEDDSDNEEQNTEDDSEEESNETAESSDQDSQEGSEETEAEAGDVDEDAIVDENQEIVANQSWLESLVGQTSNFTY